MQTDTQKICVLGSANVDSFIYVPHIPVPGETIQAENYMTANGGKGANQAVAAGKLAGGSIFTGQVGVDDQMRSLKKQMTQGNVTLMWKQLSDSHTGKAFIYLDKEGQNSIVIIGGANMKYENTKQLSQNYKSAIDKCTILQLQKQIPTQINVLAAKYGKQKGKIVMLDCGGRDDPIPSELIQNLDYISPNQTQVLRIDPQIDIENPVESIREKLISKYPKLKVVLKLGTKGSKVITDKIHVHGNVATKINKSVLGQYTIIDTVGAGDCFTSAFCTKVLETDWSDQTKQQQNYRRALIFGNSAAFLCITKKGAMPSMPDRETTDKFIQKFKLFQVTPQEKVQEKPHEEKVIQLSVQGTKPFEVKAQQKLNEVKPVQGQPLQIKLPEEKAKQCNHDHGHGHGHHGHHGHHNHHTHSHAHDHDHAHSHDEKKEDQVKE